MLITAHPGPWGVKKCTVKQNQDMDMASTKSVHDSSISDMGQNSGSPDVHKTFKFPANMSVNQQCVANTAAACADNSDIQNLPPHLSQLHGMPHLSQNGGSMLPNIARPGSTCIQSSVPLPQSTSQNRNAFTATSTSNTPNIATSNQDFQQTVQNLSAQVSGIQAQLSAMSMMGQTTQYPAGAIDQQGTQTNNANSESTFPMNYGIYSQGVPFNFANQFTPFNQGVPGVQPSPIYGSNKILPSMGGAIPGLRQVPSSVNLASLAPVEGIQEKTIRQALEGNYVSLDEFLQNFNVNNLDAGDIQSYIDTDTGNVAYRSKKQKRRVINFNTWLEAWSNYEQLMISYHGIQLYSVMVQYRMLIMSYDRKYTWPSVAMLDMRHRLFLSKKSVCFVDIDPVLLSSVFDPTSVKMGAPRCLRCKSFDHFVSECFFPENSPVPSAGSAQKPKQKSFKQNQSSAAQEICQNFNALRCVFPTCRRLHICKVCRSDLPYELCVKQGKCSLTKHNQT